MLERIHTGICSMTLSHAAAAAAAEDAAAVVLCAWKAAWYSAYRLDLPLLTLWAASHGDQCRPVEQGCAGKVRVGGQG